VLRLQEMSADLRGCAVLGSDGRVLAASGDAERWEPAAQGLLAAADAARGEPAEQVHVATEDGEVFAVRHRGLALVAVAERFTLASLMAFDMRTVLRELAAGGAVRG
jgi:predicted regulator of Ras-like GTPase activity (Roadblock/LC7/MglB family)